MIHALMYADDLIIMATSPEELQKSLDRLSLYCEKWKLNVNIKKTKIMTFSKGSNVKNHPFKINNNLVEHTKEYKYLGIHVNVKNCSFTSSLTNLSTKATRAVYALNSKLPIKNSPVRAMIKLFDSCVSPILLYGSEIWAPYADYDWKNWDKTPIERTHTQFLKRILGVNRSTTNNLARSELGRYPLQERVLKRNLTYIRYIDGKSQSSLVWNALRYEETQYNNNCQRATIFSAARRHENLLFSSNEGTLLERIKGLEDDKIRDTIRHCFLEDWKDQLNTFSKADTFKKFKDTIIMERYLQVIKNRKHRVSLTKLRLSDHCLMIEEGRHKRPITPREERFCPHCPGVVESEEHFFTQCVAYEGRADLFDRIRQIAPQFSNLNDHDKFIFMMTQGDDKIIRDIAQKTHIWRKQRLEIRKQENEIEQYISNVDIELL